MWLFDFFRCPSRLSESKREREALVQFYEQRILVMSNEIIRLKTVIAEQWGDVQHQQNRNNELEKQLAEVSLSLATCADTIRQANPLIEQIKTLVEYL